ncbi:MAG: hypothetical protein AAB250_15930 [Bdellovibrionota bacterium]
MRRFWIGFFASIVAFLAVWNLFYYSFALQIHGFDFAIWKAKFELIAPRAEAAEVVILGDSGAISGLSAVGSRRKTLNLALGCAGTVEAAAFYDRYRESHPPPRFLVIEFAEFNFREFSCLDSYALTFDLFTLRERAKILRDIEATGRAYPVFAGDESFLDALNVPLSIRPTLYLALAALHLTPNHLAAARRFVNVREWPFYQNDFERALAQRGHFVIGERASFEGTRIDGLDFDRFESSPVLIDALARILARAERDGTRALVRFDPSNPNTNDAWGANYRRGMEAAFSDLQRRFPSASIELFIRQWPNEAFGDYELHLNESGVRLETAHLEAMLDRLENE